MRVSEKKYAPGHHPHSQANLTYHEGRPLAFGAQKKKRNLTVTEEGWEQGAIITLDAMGTQRALAAQIIDQGGDYILALKGNQGKLHKGVETFFKAAEKTQWEGIEFSYSECTQAGHHRIEHRQVWAVPITQLPDLPNRSKWKGKNCVVMVKRERRLWNKTTTEE